MKKFEEKYLKTKYEIFLKISQIDLEEKKNKDYYETKSKWFS